MADGAVRNRPPHSAEVCRSLAAAGQVDRAVEATNSLPPRYRDAALELTARAAAQHGHLEAAIHTWWLVGGPSHLGVADVAATAAALAGIVHTDWCLGSIWRQVAGRFDDHQLRAVATAYPAARTPPPREAS